MNDDILKSPAFIKSLNDDIAKANAGITHDEFVTGMKNKTIGFTVVKGEPYQFTKGFGRLVFNICVMLYTLVPFLVIPIFAYREHNWWLLIGSVIASLLAPQIEQRKPYTFGGIAFLGFMGATIGFWFAGRTHYFTYFCHSYFTFFCFCAFWGCMFFRMAEDFQKEYAIQSLKNNPELFYDAVAQNRIMIIRLGS
jgi:hypothetical protein